MIMYSFIQFIGILILYTVRTVQLIRYSDVNWLWLILLFEIFISIKLAFVDTGKFPIFIRGFNNNGGCSIFHGTTRTSRQISTTASDQFTSISGQCHAIIITSASLCRYSSNGCHLFIPTIMVSHSRNPIAFICHAV